MIANECPSTIGSPVHIHGCQCHVKGVNEVTLTHFKPFVADVLQLSGSGILSKYISVTCAYRLYHSNAGWVFVFVIPVSDPWIVKYGQLLAVLSIDKIQLMALSLQ